MLIQEKYKKIISEFRDAYNEAYYIGKDLTPWQRAWLKRKIWRSLKIQIRNATRHTIN